ncbi:DUF1778 domain-containing protein [Spirillospora sp. NPDC048911]|uniref:type II toxin -antitoxin system TacA 1-like antitoxin n=1 Tax=Spirillospora sp. NPDC048911 TaxID=3364527 RepID=UPI00371B7B36
MYESVHQDLPVSHDNGHIEFLTSEEQHRVIRKAAELLGWTVPQYVLSTALDRAERDLYEHAAAHTEQARPTTPPAEEEAAVMPLVAVIAALG